MRIYIEIKRGESAEVVLNNLYQQTQMESVFGINMVALVDGRPQLMNLKQMLEAFVRHRREVVTRRTVFELRKARARAHVLEGLTVALANIDEMIELIKTSPNPNEARERMLARVWEPGLVGAMLGAAGAEASRPEDLPRAAGLIEGGYQLTEIQATQILEMRLHRLTGLEQDRLTDEYKQLLEVIAGLIHILEDPDRLLQVIREELVNVKAEFGDERRTEIRHSEEDLDILDLIAPEDVVVTVSHAGYVKRQPVSVYRAQRRGGRTQCSGDQGRGFHRTAVAGQHARYAADVHQFGQGVLAAGLPAAGSGFQRPRPSDHQLDSAGTRRTRAGRAAGARVRRWPVRVLRHEERYGQEDPWASSPSAWPAARSRSTSMRAMPWSASA